MCQLTLKRAGIGLLLSTLCILVSITTAVEFLILRTLYVGDETFTLYFHISISLQPSILVYAYLFYGITISGDVTNPLLPFIIMWIDLKPYLSTNTALIKPNETKIYKYCNSFHNTCWTLFSYLFTVLIVMPLISSLSQFLLICLMISWSWSTTLSHDQYTILLWPLLYITPNFFMYSAMLFAIPIDNYSEANLVLLMIIYWSMSMCYLLLFVICFSSKQQPSDLVMLTELLLLFAALYISLLIDYTGHDIIHSLSLIMLIITAFVDGCLLKSVPIREYVKFSNQCQLYQFSNHKGNGQDSAYKPDKLYCLIHHTLYHKAEIVENNGYRYQNVLHEMDSLQCYEVQHQFMSMNEADKKQHIDQLLVTKHVQLIKNGRFQQFEHVCFTLYWVISMIVSIFPIIWLFYVLLISKGIIDIYQYQDIFVVIVIILYAIMLVVTSYHMYIDYEKYQIIAKLKQIYNVSNINETDANQLNKIYAKMLIAQEIISVTQLDIAYIILLYMYGATEFEDKNEKYMQIKDEE